MIIDPPITSISKRANCRYTLIVEVSKRARQLVAGAEPLIPTTETKPVSIAVRAGGSGSSDRLHPG